LKNTISNIRIFFASDEIFLNKKMSRRCNELTVLKTSEVEYFLRECCIAANLS